MEIDDLYRFGELEDYDFKKENTEILPYNTISSNFLEDFESENDVIGLYEFVIKFRKEIQNRSLNNDQIEVLYHYLENMYDDEVDNFKQLLFNIYDNLIRFIYERDDKRTLYNASRVYSSTQWLKITLNTRSEYMQEFLKNECIKDEIQKEVYAEVLSKLIEENKRGHLTLDIDKVPKELSWTLEYLSNPIEIIKLLQKYTYNSDAEFYFNL